MVLKILFVISVSIKKGEKIDKITKLLRIIPLITI